MPSSMYVNFKYIFSVFNRFSVSHDSLNVITGLHLPHMVVSEIKQVYAYPEYQFLTNQNDVALVEVSLYSQNVFIFIFLTIYKWPNWCLCV